MIVWSGHGYLVAVAVFVLSLGMEVATEAHFQDDSYYQREGWPLALALILAGIFSLELGRRLNRPGGRVLIDRETGAEVHTTPGNHHRLFFIPMQYWGPILFIGGLAVWVARAMKSGG
jgi:hypothetical protein